jgi:hypothetical protein
MRASPLVRARPVYRRFNVILKAQFKISWHVFKRSSTPTGLGKLFRILRLSGRHAKKAARLDSCRIRKRKMAILGHHASARGLIKLCAMQSHQCRIFVDGLNAAGSRWGHAVAQMLLALSALSLVLTIASCASPWTQEKAPSAQGRSIQNKSTQEIAFQENSTTHRVGPTHQQPGWRVHSYRPLPAHAPAPNCELAEAQPDTVDAELWARLKLDYERHCYKQAEMVVRKRLQQLLTSGRCRIEPN